MKKKRTARPESFDLKKFYRQVNIAAGEREAVTDCLARGLERYYHYVYGYDKYGKYPAFLISERMHEPYIFGFGAVEAVRRDSLSLDARLKIIQYAIEHIDAAAEYGTPHGLPVMLSFLAGAKRLDPLVFRSVMIAAELGGDLFDDWQLGEVRRLLDWLITQAGMPGPERVWWIWHISLQCRQAQMCRALAEGVLAHPRLSAARKRALCEAWLADTPAGKAPAQWEATQALLSGDMEAFKAHAAEAGLPAPDDLPGREAMEVGYDATLDDLMYDADAVFEPPGPSLHMLRNMLIGPMGLIALTPHALKRAAVAALPQLGEDPLAVCEKYLGATRHYDADAVNGGVADVMRAYHARLPHVQTRALIERGLQIGSVSTRKAFYQLGAELFGDEYRERAAADKAKSVRAWAAKKTGGLTGRGRKPTPEGS